MLTQTPGIANQAPATVLLEGLPSSDLISEPEPRKAKLKDIRRAPGESHAVSVSSKSWGPWNMGTQATNPWPLKCRFFPARLSMYYSPFDERTCASSSD